MPIMIEDSTMREGEQSPGVVFSPQEKLELARRLEEVGVDAAEVGTPAMGGAEEEAIRGMVEAGLKIRLIGWNRGRIEDLEKSFACGLNSVHIGLPASDIHITGKFGRTREWVLGTMQELVQAAKARGAWVSVSAEDTGRTDLGFLVEYAQAVKAAGADRMRVSDTIGVMNPMSVERVFTTLVREVPDFAFQPHMHNDLGMATANTLTAVRCGARHLHATVNGLGDRAGIAALEEVALGLELHLGLPQQLRTEKLTSLCDYVARISGRPIPPNKAVTGRSMFEHESGIHVDGVLDRPDYFEAIPPEKVGGVRRIVLGKHSGSAAVRFALRQVGVEEPEDAVVSRTVTRAREEAMRVRRELSFEEVRGLYESLQPQGA